MLQELIDKLIAKQDLTPKESSLAIHEILECANPHQVAAFLVLMRAKGETVDELVGIIQAMQHFMVPVIIDVPVLDIVGTGGDRSNSINISTAASIIAAACGVKIAKHGNRSVSSLCGSADLLEALGICIDMGADAVKHSIEKAGIGFMFAPKFHPAMKSLATIRKDLKVRTAFNMIGPLLNPAKAPYQLIGVFDEKLLELLSLCLLRLGTTRSLVFHGSGMDELSTLGPAKVVEVTQAGLRSFVIDPLKFGLPKATKDDLKGSNPQENAKRIIDVFKGETGPIADTLALNAGVALQVYGIAATYEEGILIAQDKLKRGEAFKLLEEWRKQCPTI